jgi:hypothetical protein
MFSSAIQRRDMLFIALMLLVTCGFYYIYWAVKTKNEINSLGGHIPTAWLAIIPFANFYFWYKYAQDFVRYVLKGEQSSVISYFLLIAVLPIVGIFIIQSHLNELA